MKNIPSEFVFTDDDGKEYVEYEYFKEINRIALESKLIVEQFQKLPGVYTTTEAFAKTAVLMREEEESERERNIINLCCDWYRTGQDIVRQSLWYEIGVMLENNQDKE
jgi:hypothetical protein